MFSLKENPVKLLKLIKKIPDEVARKHVHFMIYYRWTGSKEDKEILRDGVDMTIGLEQSTTVDGMKKALKIINAPPQLTKDVLYSISRNENRKKRSAFHHVRLVKFNEDVRN